MMTTLQVYLKAQVTGLKEQCHDHFAVLGQFCAKIITLRLLIKNKMLQSVKLQQTYQMNFIREGEP